MKVYILGGSGADASGTINGFEDFKKYITEGGNFSKTSPGAPISYKLRYINDNKIGKIVFAARYPIVTAIPRTDNVVYDIKALMANMKLNISDAGGNAEIYGNVKSWPASLGESAAHIHFDRSASNYQSFSENENAGNENADESLDTESMAVYDYMSAAGILSAGDAGIIRNGSTAKGTFYSVFETGEADGNTYENRLVYDRVSENGQCDLFVYEQLVSGSDTRLLGFYAVNKTTNEVFSG
jgi:hypothetical protein